MQANGGTQTQDQLEQAQQDLQDAEDGVDEHSYAIVERGIILGGSSVDWWTSLRGERTATSICAG